AVRHRGPALRPRARAGEGVGARGDHPRRPDTAARGAGLGGRLRRGGVHGMSATEPAGRVELLSGWGRTPVSASRVERPASPDELASAVKRAGSSGAVPRGLGRAYGDSAMNAGGTVVCSTRVSGLLDLDEHAGTARVLAGTSIDELLRLIVPRGWFVPVTPGTRHITIGGAIAADVHGKDHHVAGSFGAHVTSMVVALADGTSRVLRP